MLLLGFRTHFGPFISLISRWRSLGTIWVLFLDASWGRPGGVPWELFGDLLDTLGATVGSLCCSLVPWATAWDHFGSNLGDFGFLCGSRGSLLREKQTDPDSRFD